MDTIELALKTNNLFSNGFIVAFNSSEGLLLRDKLDLGVGSEADEYYTVVQDDCLDAIAYKKYSPFVEDSSKLWWIIADANDIQNPLDIDHLVGTTILIPNILNVLLILD